MAPIKSSLARSAKQLLGLFNTADLGLRGATQSTRLAPPEPFSATGGQKFTPGDGFHYHVIISSTPSPTKNIVATNGAGSVDNCSILIVGGGGGGASLHGPGAAAGAGGGAGGMVYATDILLPFQATNPITIGTGGAIAPPAYYVTGTNGGDTTITLGSSLTLTGKGGGGGAMYSVNGADGGSGGGAAYDGANGGATTQAPANPVPFQPYCFGTAGGDGHPSPNVYNGAGGGGAGGAGEPAPADGGGGSTGKATVFVSPLFPGMNATFLTAIGPNGKFAQGGGGGTYDPNTGSASGYAGGGGGGGGGPRNDISPSSQKAGVDNTGSGGGMGDGGDGIVILKYPINAQYS